MKPVRPKSLRGVTRRRSWLCRSSPFPSLISAFRRLVREGRVTVSQYAQLKLDLLTDLADALLCNTSPQVVQRAIDALETATLREMDAVHVGAAIVCSADVFVSADARQGAAAASFGLRVVTV